MNWKWLVGIGAGLIVATALVAFLVLPRLEQYEFDPGVPRAIRPAPLKPAYWTGADAAPPVLVAFEKTEVAPGAQQAALLGAAIADKVQALLKTAHTCDTARLVVYSRSGHPKQLLSTDCRRTDTAHPEGVKDDYPTLLVLEGENLSEVQGLEEYGFKYDSGRLAGVSDIHRSGDLELWLNGTVSDCEGQAECEPQGSIIVAMTAEGLKKQEYSMDASCPAIRKAEENGKANCVCGPSLLPYGDRVSSAYAGMTLAAVCGYAEAEGNGSDSAESAVTGVAYFTGAARINGMLVSRNDAGLGFIDPMQQGATLLFEDNARAVLASKAPLADDDDPCMSAPASMSLTLLKTVLGGGRAYAQGYAFGKIGKFRDCAQG